MQEGAPGAAAQMGAAQTAANSGSRNLPSGHGAQGFYTDLLLLIWLTQLLQLFCLIHCKIL